jgi:hypothetical protein
MKVGGNESATKFFQQNGGTAALNSKDPKTKYQSNAATKYKEELKRRAARDAQESVFILLRFDAFHIQPAPNFPVLGILLRLWLTVPMRTALLLPPASLKTTSSHPGTNPRSSDLHLLFHGLERPQAEPLPLSSAPATARM